MIIELGLECILQCLYVKYFEVFSLKVFLKESHIKSAFDNDFKKYL